MQVELLQTGQDRKLSGRIWTGDQSPATDTDTATDRVIYVCIHGLGDHGGHFESFAQTATDAGHAVVTMDLRGHGDSPGRKGHARSYDGLLTDIAALRRDALTRFPGIPQTLLGHSMGGNLVVNYTLRHTEFDEPSNPAGDPLPPPAAMILLSPMFLPPQHVTRPQIFAAWLTGYVLPAIRVTKKAELSDLTAVEDQAAAIARDPKRHGKLSIYLATQLLSQGRWALDHCREITIPSLLIYGNADTMVDRQAVANAAVRMGSNATLLDWKDARHDLLHDTDATLITRRILTWTHSLAATPPPELAATR